MKSFRMIFAVLAGVLSVVPADAGQVRVNVASNNTFSPSSVSLNPGDHVVWVWLGSGHSVTQGSSCNPSGGFDSGIRNSPATFSWKAGTQSTSYFCQPHCLTMTGFINVNPLGTQPIADFRIVELRYTLDHANDFIEIANLGGLQGNLGNYRVSINGGGSLTIPDNDVPVAAGARVLLHFGTAGTNTNTDFFFASATLPSSGSAALFAPNTAAPAFTADMIIDFVQWAGSGQGNESVAASAEIWTSGTFVAGVADGHAIEFCGNPDERGAEFWLGVATPNPGSDGNCATPARPVTWGLLKAFRK